MARQSTVTAVEPTTTVEVAVLGAACGRRHGHFRVVMATGAALALSMHAACSRPSSPGTGRGGDDGAGRRTIRRQRWIPGLGVSGCRALLFVVCLPRLRGSAPWIVVIHRIGSCRSRPPSMPSAPRSRSWSNPHSEPLRGLWAGLCVACRRLCSGCPGRSCWF